MKIFLKVSLFFLDTIVFLYSIYYYYYYYYYYSIIDRKKIRTQLLRLKHEKWSFKKQNKLMKKNQSKERTSVYNSHDVV